MKAEARPPAGAWLAAQIWVWLAAWLSATGWILSAIGQLNFAGYTFSLALGAWLFWRWNRRAGAVGKLLESTRRFFRRRRRRPIEWLFLVILLLALIGGAAHAPSTYDTLTYRLPQALNWLERGAWFWVSTIDIRINFAPPGQSWLFAPVLLFTRSLRLLFLTNILSFALLPGLLFGYLVACGVHRRVAACWMYLAACAFGYVLQAGSVANDLLGAVFALAAVGFALRANVSRKASDLWTAALALALCTAVKTTNLPLLLPLAVAAWPALRLLRAKWLASAAVGACALLISFLPTAILNRHYTGDWSGDPANVAMMKMSSPAYAFIGNVLVIGTQIFDPPINPFLPQWTRLLRTLDETALVQETRRHFPRIAFAPHEMAIEEEASLGLGVGGLLLFCGVLRWSQRKSHPRSWHAALVVWAPWGSLLFFLCAVGSEASQRHLISYYALLMPAFLGTGLGGDFNRRGWRRWVALLAGGMVLIPLILSPARPLLPLRWAAEQLALRNPEARFWQRASAIYKTYGDRAELLAPLREHVPANEPVIGFIAGMDVPETALWKPFGSRRVTRLVLEPGPGEQVRRADLRWLVVSEQGVAELYGQSLAEFLAEVHGRVVYSQRLVITVRHPPHDFHVIEITPP